MNQAMPSQFLTSVTSIITVLGGSYPPPQQFQVILHLDLYECQILHCKGDMVDGRRTCGVVFPTLKGRQLHIYFRDSERFFSTK